MTRPSKTGARSTETSGKSAKTGRSPKVRRYRGAPSLRTTLLYGRDLHPKLLSLGWHTFSEPDVLFVEKNLAQAFLVRPRHGSFGDLSRYANAWFELLWEEGSNPPLQVSGGKAP